VGACSQRSDLAVAPVQPAEPPRASSDAIAPQPARLLAGLTRQYKVHIQTVGGACAVAQEKRWNFSQGVGQNTNMARLSDIRLSFNEIPDLYDKIRPSYPPELFNALFEMLPTEPTIVEVGPGTGQATRDLLDRGAKVHAIELGTAMAAKLRSNLPSDRLRVTISDFELLEIPPATADAVFSATAYHWISPAAQTDRPTSILRSNGIIAIVDLIQVDSASDLGFFTAAQPLYARHGQGHTGPPAPTRSQVDPPIRVALEADERFTDVKTHHYDWDQTYSAADYRNLMLSYSTTRMMSTANRSALLDELVTFIDVQFDGQITRPLVVTLTTAVLA
jgi:SAM-dependent methyltransferase